jgi:hypothetical protein
VGRGSSQVEDDFIAAILVEAADRNSVSALLSMASSGEVSTAAEFHSKRTVGILCTAEDHVIKRSTGISRSDQYVDVAVTSPGRGNRRRWIGEEDESSSFPSR